MRVALYFERLQAKEYKSLIYKGPGVFMNWAMFAHFTHS
jgi:hypothetical protein